MEIIKCPHCSNLITSLKISSIDTDCHHPASSKIEKIKVIAYSCPLPQCMKVISIQEDMLSLKKILISTITNLLRGH